MNITKSFHKMAEETSSSSSSWQMLTQDLPQELVHGQIMSALKLLVLNISDQFYTKNPLFHLTFEKFPSAQETIYEMKNLTASLFPESFNIRDDNPTLEVAFETILLLGTFLQYFVTFATVLVISWIFNRLTLKNSVIEEICETVIAFLIFVPVLPPIAVFFGILLIIRTSIWIYLKVFHSDGKFSLLCAQDAFWAAETFGSSSASLGLYIIQGICDPDKIEKRIMETITSDLVGGKMSKEIVSILGFPCWKHIPNLNIKDYVKVVLVNNNESVSEKELFEFMRSVQDHPIRGRAPWEVNIIPKFAYENSSSDNNANYYAVIFRIHHGIMDGISTGNILHSVMADKPFKFSLDPMTPLGVNKQSNFKTFLIFFLGLLSLPRISLRNLSLMDNIHNKYYFPGPLLTGPKTFTWSRPIRMDALKQIKNSTKTSVYSVLLTSLGGAFRQLYTKNGIRTKSDYLHAMSPIALLPYPNRKPMNRFTGVLVPAFIGEKGSYSPLERLEINFNNLKKMGSTSGNFTAIANWYFPFMQGMMPLFLQKIFAPMVHLKMSLSNIPGPAESVYIFDGGKIVDIGIWLPIKFTVGVGVGLFTNADRVRATVIGDKANFPNESDVQFLSDKFEQELKLLAESVGLQENMLYMSK